MNKSLSSLVLVASAALVSIGAAGCSTETGNVDQDTDATESNLGTAINVPNPNGAYFASVTANGSGCPAGTWDAAISDDGQTFTLRFSQYETTIDPGQAIAIKDCQLAIKLHSPQGLSYAVSSFYYSGYAFLDSNGMNAAQTAKYYFQGNPIASNENRSDLRGPLDKEYVFSDNVGTVDLVWSKCGVDRDLNVATRVLLRNNTRKTGSGYISNTTVDGSVELKFKLSWRSC
jgi:hypothetical protein